ncbi:large ribosomal subunit protein mL41-like [Glandiceps talaboti]
MPTIGNILRGLTRGANRHLKLTGKRGPRNFVTTRCQRTGYFRSGKFVIVPEMIPEIVVPNLKDFQLQAYVSHRCPDTLQEAYTTKDVFDMCVAPQIIEDFKAGKYDQPETNTTDESLKS